MTKGFFFKSKQVAEILRDSVNTGNMPAPLTPAASLLSEGWLFKTPSGGIAARSGTTLTSAACTPYYINPETDTLTELTDQDGNSITYDVYNYVSTAITGEAYIAAFLCFNVFVAVSEDCN